MPLTILVADDNLGTRLSVSDYLEMSGYSVVTAEDGQEALSLIDTYHPHLIVTDINMPKMDGYALVQKVRQKPAFRLLPVIFLTERSSTEERIRGYQLGCDLYLPKPFEMKELGAVIRNLLERSQIVQTELRFSSTEAVQTPLPTAVGESVPKLNPMHSETVQTQSDALHLTKREQQVLDLLTKGLSNGEIGNQLHLSSRTVEKYVSSLLRKTETSNRAEIVRFAMENRLVD
ncbi:MULTISPECIES: response regulator transcription factor [unclassified Coleofasciculus]|uniref:response regulator transcription factor n=1 Tax=unclassified Coleofasciculus TaxID=2692782 RepID=UPI0018830BE3|nr:MULTISPECIES: response regulator transcription factor [unclassified Coleofasciculus]MBE9128884.1 response regulator transcription factor [Coleofasciculus sp. LEGE 07081]MBE9151609.1 response regulator transcription factor [Coleofasciculus sp. LEGE 07092]